MLWLININCYNTVIIIIILHPGVDSWDKCTHFAKECNGDCIGCSPEDMQNESFPLFPALLNVKGDQNSTDDQ